MNSLETTIAHHLRRLIDIASYNGKWTINHSVGDVIEALAAEVDVKPVAFAELAGKASKHMGLVISPPGGSKQRISVAIRALEANAPILFVVGCFKGTGAMLLKDSEQKHGNGTNENKHYVSFRETAENLLAWPEKLPSLADTIYDRVQAIHYRRMARATQPKAFP